MLTTHFPRIQVPLTAIAELAEPFSFEHDDPVTWRDIVEHVRLINTADLNFPIILSADGRVMDGMHRVIKALLENRLSIESVQFSSDPEADYVGLSPKDLPYDDSVSPSRTFLSGN